MSVPYDEPCPLPPFESLSEEDRRGIVRAISREDKWRMAGYELGPVHAAVVRMLRRIAARRGPGAASEFLWLLVSAVQSGPARTLHGLFRTWDEVRIRFQGSFPIAASPIPPGTNLKDLAVEYATGIPQLEGYRGYWHDPSRDNTVGLVVGMDFVPSADGYWFVESNLDAALRPQRSDLYGVDPFVSNLVDFAVKRRYRRLVIVPGNTVSLDQRMSAQLVREAGKCGLDLTIVDDKFLPGAGHPRSLKVPALCDRGTLVARIRRYQTALDYLVADKRATDRALRAYVRETGDASFRLPPTGSLEEVFQPAGAEPFPNLVYKLAAWDQGQGVVFVKASTLGDARQMLSEAIRAARPRGATASLVFSAARQSGLLQRFVRSDARGAERLHIIRAHVFLSPVGIQFLSAHRVIARAPVPDTLPFGVVRNPAPYLVNYSSGARYEVTTPAEEEDSARAALGVAAGLKRSIEFAFRSER